jgi:hypothetical protein
MEGRNVHLPALQTKNEVEKRVSPLAAPPAAGDRKPPLFEYLSCPATGNPLDADPKEDQILGVIFLS